jgi:hypothetical protein
MSGITKGIINIAIAVAILLGGAAVCLWFIGYIPVSENEFLFRSRLSKYAAEGKAEIPLTDLASFDWEMVCENHPYDGPVYLKKYGRSYGAPESSAHKGVWVLLFVASDGSATHITGGCTRGGARIDFNVRCLDRNRASLKLRKTGECPQYEGVAVEHSP